MHVDRPDVAFGFVSNEIPIWRENRISLGPCTCSQLASFARLKGYQEQVVVITEIRKKRMAKIPVGIVEDSSGAVWREHELARRARLDDFFEAEPGPVRGRVIGAYSCRHAAQENDCGAYELFDRGTHGAPSQHRAAVLGRHSKLCKIRTRS